MAEPAELKQRIRTDLTAAMKSRDQLVTGTLRMALAAITNEEVAGTSAKELTDPDVVRVLTREVKKRNESAEVYAGAGRSELADNERAEAAILERYLPQQLTDAELTDLVDGAVAEVAGGGEQPGMKQMGQVIKAANDKAAGRADGKRIADAVKQRLSG
ncbi:GatB/YqeY domain-containing protein [Nakamurella aerolata]|uniref:GatB/YqeY domain-containing protein n=1 Tax=Nakamurella aerolata TaxID=1656892 RepID=A0A849A6X4_9ACTN|nr:GatB/YqeY domain-containing protein [Nakamurella aerolata]NNG35787.1 GatB/YqeY domain-containing protein [Nakamurella aerolata]